MPIRRGSAWRSRAAAALTLATAAWLVIAPAAHATLGGAYNTIETDRAHLAATAQAASSIGFTVSTLTLANNATVREYSRPDGVVFAITWHGSSRPDLRQLLGSRFDTLQADNTAAAGRRRARGPMTVNRSDFVVRTSGHPGAFSGVAYLPGLAPAGFSASSLR